MTGEHASPISPLSTCWRKSKVFIDAASEEKSCTDRAAAGYKGELSHLRITPSWLGVRYGQSENTCKHQQQDLEYKYYVNRPQSVRCTLQSDHQISQYTASRPPHYSIDKEITMTAGRHLLTSIRWPGGRSRPDRTAEDDSSKKLVRLEKISLSGK